jgi:glycosyltransferase involved in cell wall biosynthesis
MKLVHVVPHLDEEAAGPTPAVMRLCESLAAAGNEVDLHTMAGGRVPEGVRLHVHREWRLPPRFGFSPHLVGTLAKAVAGADIVHNHSLWSYPNMAAGLACARDKVLVTSPHGTLAAAARQRSRWRKLVFSPLQRPAIARAACLHATSEMELRDIRDAGLRQPVVLLPNGIDVPPVDAPSSTVDGMRRLLFLGRIHPIKGIELLLEAWSALQSRHPDWELVIAGKGDADYVAGLQAMAARLGLQRVTFPGPVYGEAKQALFGSAQAFVLPTHTENFGMAVAEALAVGVPVITTRGAPWAGLATTGSGWWIERTLDALVAALDQAMATDPSGLAEMGGRGRSWMQRDFSWPAIADSMAASYRWLLSGGTPPACMHLE